MIIVILFVDINNFAMAITGPYHSLLKMYALNILCDKNKYYLKEVQIMVLQDCAV